VRKRAEEVAKGLKKGLYSGTRKRIKSIKAQQKD
jgi:hypothetical protein